MTVRGRVGNKYSGRWPKSALLLIFLWLLTACSLVSPPEFAPAQADRSAPTLRPPNPATHTPAADAGAYLPGADQIGDPYFQGMGNGGYDVLHYELTLDVDVAGGNIEAAARIQARALQNLSTFNLDFRGLQIDSLQVNSVQADFSRDGSELIVRPEEGIPQGDVFEVAVHYHGNPGETVDGPVTHSSSSWIEYGNGIYVAGEPTGAAGWYPVNEHPADKASYTFIVTVPEPYSVAANGLLVNTDHQDRKRTFTWEAEDPIASYLAAVNIADFERVESVAPNGVPIRNYFARGVTAQVRSQFDSQGEMLTLYSERFGPYPFPAYGVVVHDVGFRFALEVQTLSLFGNTFNNEIVVAHELAHQWFGDSVGLVRWQDIWLNEGFATYASAIWNGHANGRQAFEGMLAGMYGNIAPGIPAFTYSKAELLENLRSYPMQGGSLPREQVVLALSDLLEDDLSPEQIRQAAAGYPDLIAREDVMAILADLDFQSAHFGGDRWIAFLDFLGLEDLHTGLGGFPPPGDPGPDQLFSNSVYQRGALALHALRLRVGDDNFWEILQNYAKTYQYGNATTEDFIAISEAISGMELDDLFQAWLYDRDIPDLPELNLYRADFTP